MTDYDFTLYTDGSGHTDGFGGWGALVLSTKHNLYKTLMVSHSQTTVDRAETQALLDGLQMILEALDWTGPGKLQDLERNPPTVLWVSDRENLVRSVTRDADGNPIYARRSSPDLWLRFSFYEKLFAITAHQTPRAELPNHDIVDRLASDGRTLVKNYLTLPDNRVERLLYESARRSAEQEAVPPPTSTP